MGIKLPKDAQTCLQERVGDLENVCFAEEGKYWSKPGSRSVARKVRT